MSARTRVFLLSPANCSGERARRLLKAGAPSLIAHRLRGPDGVPLGEVFAFLSSLYFRGKLSYARAFARPPDGIPGVLVITAGLRLWPAEEPVRLADIRGFARVAIDATEPRYRRSLEHDARKLGRSVGDGCEVVLLGSIATGKYVDALHDVLGPSLRFPSDFVGRGDMSRGGLMLRCVREGRELAYTPITGAARHGPRPRRLTRFQ